MLPNAKFTKSDGNTGVVKPATTGILAIIAASAIGTANQAGTYARQADALAAVGLGPLVESGGYFMQNAGKPCLLIKATTSTAATYSAVAFTGTGTSVVTAGGSAPFDDYDVIVNFITGGTIGVTGITFKYSLDGGVTFSPVTALGTANTLTLNAPVVASSSGTSFAFAAGTIVAGDSFTCRTSRAQMTNSDLVTALEALRVSSLPWDAVLIDGDCTATTISTVDSWLAALEAVGVYKMAYMNTRRKTRPAPSGETEPAYATAMATLLASSATIRIDVGTDGGDVPSPVTGLSQFRPTALGVATRALKFPIGVDPAEVDNGPLPGYLIADANGNPKHHNEELYPGLDDLRLTTLRSIAGKTGTYITNARILSAAGSDYVYDQHARTMNAACTVAKARLTDELSKSVRKQAPTQTGAIYILELDAAAIDVTVTAAMGVELKDQVNDQAFILSRTDDIGSNVGATVNGEVQIQSLAYLKNINVTTKFVRSITVKA